MAYPKWMYNAKQSAVLVPDAQMEKALGPGWCDTVELAKEYVPPVLPSAADLDAVAAEKKAADATSKGKK